MLCLRFRSRASVLIVALALLSSRIQGCAGSEGITVGFWFDDVSYESVALGGRLTEADLEVIKSVAMAEVESAFAGMRIDVSTRRDARCRVGVVQNIREARVHSAGESPSGRSRSFPGGGGDGAVSFAFLAGGAVVYAPPGTTREHMVQAIGRGVGRAAVHELTHQLLPRAPIDLSKDVQSYEYYSGARVEQFYGPMRWAMAGPLLENRYGIRPEAGR